MTDEQPDHDQLISSFMDLTSTNTATARAHLTASAWNLDGAVGEYYTAMEEEPATQEAAEDEEMVEAPYTGPRTLDGRPAPSAIPTTSSSKSAPPKKKTGGINTLGSIAPADPHAGHGHGHDDDDDSDDEDFDPDEEPRDLFAGGEKSGLAVQDPSQKRLVKDILKKARANAQRPGGEPSAAGPPSRFRGGGQTLGGDDAPSRAIPDPNPQAPELRQTATRILHLWEDGFSIEDGPLRRFSDPQHAADLAMIRDGRAPLHLMGVRPDEPVDVQLIKHDEEYKPQPKKYKPFSGQGNRLGSPTPGPSGSSTSTTTSYAASTPAVAPAATPAAPEIDASQPTISLRVQLANGTRLPARFNHTHTIGDVYQFIQRADVNSADRPWVLATTFPNKDHTDKSLQLGDMAEFKRGGTAVQKWA